MIKEIMTLGLGTLMLCLATQPVSAQNALGSVLAANQSANETITTDEATISLIEDFSCWYVSYFGGYQNFDKGYYGIGWESFSKSGAFANVSFHGSWGIMDPGEYQFRFGGGYGIAPAKFIAITGRINGMLGSYTDYKFNEKTGKITNESKFGGGILFAPGVRVKYGKLSFGVNFDLGWAYYGGSGFYKDVELHLGYKF